jgi:hypothetical protein
MASDIELNPEDDPSTYSIRDQLNINDIADECAQMACAYHVHDLQWRICDIRTIRVESGKAYGVKECIAEALKRNPGYAMYYPAPEPRIPQGGTPPARSSSPGMSGAQTVELMRRGVIPETRSPLQRGGFEAGNAQRKILTSAVKSARKK